MDISYSYLKNPFQFFLYRIFQLQLEVTSTRYETYYVEGFGADRMNALCLSLAGYAYRALDWNHQSLQMFQTALCSYDKYPAASENVRIQGRLLKRLSRRKSCSSD